jgi:hypothetical protein
MSEPSPLDGYLEEIAAQLVAAKLRLEHATGSDVAACQQSVTRLDGIRRTLELFQSFEAPARRFFVNCLKIEREAQGDPTALSVLAELPGAELRVGATGAFTGKRK